MRTAFFWGLQQKYPKKSGYITVVIYPDFFTYAGISTTLFDVKILKSLIFLLGRDCKINFALLHCVAHRSFFPIGEYWKSERDCNRHSRITFIWCEATLQINLQLPHIKWKSHSVEWRNNLFRICGSWGIWTAEPSQGDLWKSTYFRPATPLTKNHRRAIRATAERSEADFGRMVRKTRFHAAWSTKKATDSNPSLSLDNQWELRDSNPRPSACKADALNQLS